jgi:hypothetical protein
MESRLWGTTGKAMGLRKCEGQNALKKMGSDVVASTFKLSYPGGRDQDWFKASPDAKF